MTVFQCYRKRATYTIQQYQASYICNKILNLFINSFKTKFSKSTQSSVLQKKYSCTDRIPESKFAQCSASFH